MASYERGWACHTGIISPLQEAVIPTIQVRREERLTFEGPSYEYSNFHEILGASIAGLVRFI